MKASSQDDIDKPHSESQTTAAARHQADDRVSAAITVVQDGDGLMASLDLSAG